MLGRWKKWMAESLLPFQCNHVVVEGLWKNTNTKKIQKLKREKVETDKRKRRRKRRKKKKEEKQLQRMKRSPALPHPPPHRHSSSSLPPDWIRLAYSFFFFSFFHICLFWFNFIIRIGFCFVFCVWIMWDVFWEWSKETEIKRW